MPNDPLDAMKARWNHIQASLFPWLREEVDPLRIPTKPAMHSKMKPATCSDPKPAGVPI